MNRTTLPAPPDPQQAKYANNMRAWTIDVYAWMSQVKKKIETDSTVNTRPVSPFVLATYTAVNTLTGTDATSNFVATFVQALQDKGISATRSAT